MNIINHLATEITPKVLHNKVDTNKAQLLEKFYSIIVVRLTDKKSYDKLVNIARKKKGKKANKVRYADFVHQLEWSALSEEGNAVSSQANSMVSVVERLEQEHELGLAETKRLCQEAIPLTIQELQKVANSKNVPEYLTKLLSQSMDGDEDTASAFGAVFPHWALTVFPQGVIASDIMSNNLTATTSVSNISADSPKKLDKTVDVDEQDSDEQNSDEQDANEVQAPSKSTTDDTDSNETAVETASDTTNQQNSPQESETSTESNTATSKAVEEDGQVHDITEVKSTKKLPEPVHVEPPPRVNTITDADEGILDELDVTTSSEQKSKGAPIAGILLLGLLSWLILKGCQNTETAYTAQTKVEEAQESAEKSAPSIDLMPAVLKIEVDEEGKLSSSKMVSGSEKLDNKVKSAMIHVFGSVPDSAEFNVDENMQKHMPVSKNINDLLILIKSVPNSAMIINGTDISFTAPNVEAQKQLVSSAQALLPSFIVSSEVSKKALVALKEDVADTDTTVSEATQTSNEQNSHTENVHAQSTDSEVQATEATTSEQAEVTPSSTEQSDQAVTEVASTSASPELDIDAEVKKSLTVANKALDELAKQQSITPDELSKALNLQVINFAVNQAKIPEENQKLLIKAAKLMKKIPHSRLRIIGHTDSAGNDDYNQRLSNDRAFSVKKFFIKQGIKSVHMKEIGMGEAQPVATNETKEGRFRNRRIEFIVKQSTPAS